MSGDSYIGTSCPACHVSFVARDWVARIEVGPGGDPAARTAARMNASYLPVTVAVHWQCHTGQTNPPPDRSDRPNSSNARAWMQF